MIDFHPQCCDTYWYLTAGRACALEGQCWNSLRPVGSVLYASLPFRLGLPPETLILINAFLIGVSIVLGTIAISSQYRARGWLCLTAYAAAVFLVHAVYTWGVVHTALSDAPAAALALVGLWLWVLPPSRVRWVCSGMVLGLAALFRLAYLYPVVLTVAGALLWSRLSRKVDRAGLTAFAVAALVPILCQVLLTRSHTGQWGFIDPSLARQVYAVYIASPFNFAQSTLVGFDSLIEGQVGRAYHYHLTTCFWGERLPGVLCLGAQRVFFYLGSFAPDAYLTSPDQRVFSVALLLAHLVVITLGVASLARTSTGLQFLGTAVLVGSFWAEAVMAIPESRFLIMPLVFLGSQGVVAVVHWLGTRLVGGRFG
jgi:hypothetical protein